MSAVGGFVHLYHIWGIWGLITACIYGPRAWVGWRMEDGRLRSAPGEYAAVSRHYFVETCRDVVRLLLGISRGLFGIGPIPPEQKPTPWRYGPIQMLTLGIASGGVARFLTALYWSEKNRAWMTETTVWLPAVPVLIAIFADTHHHLVVFKDSPWVSRWSKIAAVVWVAIGLWGT